MRFGRGRQCDSAASRFSLGTASRRNFLGEATIVKKDPESRTGSPVEAGPVLVAVDFSPDSEAALLWACGYAAQVGADVVVLHVVHDPVEAPGSYRRSEADALRPMEEIAAEVLDQFIEKFGKAHPELQALVTLKTRLVSGLPATRIVEVADKIEARMIVVGSRGLTGLPHLLLGSKAERVAQLASRPVTIVKVREDHD